MQVPFRSTDDSPEYGAEYEPKIPVAGLKGALNRIFEISIPLASLGAERFEFLPIVRDAEKEKNYDEWGGWIIVDQGLQCDALEERPEAFRKLVKAGRDGRGPGIGGSMKNSSVSC